MGEKQVKNPLGGLGSTKMLKFIKAELNTPQNKVLLGMGVVAAAGVFGYIAYVRHKYERLGYYMALREDGRTEFIKRTSNWET